MGVANKLSQIAESCFLLTLSLTLVFPLEFGKLKVTLLACCAVSLLVAELSSQQRQIGVHRSVFFWMVALLAVNGLFVLRGLLNGASADASAEVLLVYVAYPLFYFCLIFLIPSILDPTRLAKTLIAVSLVVSFLTISQFARVVSSYTFPGYSFLYLIYPDLAVDYMNYSFTGFDSFLPRATERLVFLAPFSVGLIFAGRALGLSKIVVFSNFIIVATATAFTGRRAFLVVLVLAVVAALVLWFLKAPRRPARLLAIWLGVAVLSVGVASLVGLSSSLPGAGEENGIEYVARNLGSVNVDIRAAQVDEIAGEADKSPLIGAGFGNGIAGYVRDPEHPWRVELTYLALLFQTGIVGIFLYTMVTLQVLRILGAAVKARGVLLLPIVFGMAGGMLAVATNPYLNYGTGQWILFLPVAVFNSVLFRDSLDSARRTNLSA